MYRFNRSQSLTLFALIVAAAGPAYAEDTVPTAPVGDSPPTATEPAADPTPPPAEETPSEPTDQAPPAEPTPPVEPVPPPAAPTEPMGTITGTVTDPIAELGLPGATIQVSNGSKIIATTQSELDGTYTIKLPPGTYTVIIATPEFIEASRPVTVVVDKSLTLDVVMEPLPKTATGETIEIVGTIDTRRESAVLAERRAAATVSDAVSAQEISRTPDSNASDAVKRVVAVTVVEGKYVALRGLEGRYVTSLLNGVLLPSPEPDRNAVPLDLFPTNLLATMTVYKSYSPELPGQFGGGTLAISTTSFPTEFEMRVGLSTSANTVATGQDGLGNAATSGVRNFLGFDNGSRALPDAVPRTRAVRNMDAAQMEQIGESMPNVWTPTDDTVSPNVGVTVAVGDSAIVGGKRIGYLATGMMRRSFSVREAQAGKTALVGGELTQIEDLSFNVGSAEATVGGLANVGIDLNADNQLNLLGLYTHVGEDTTSFANGYSEADGSDIAVSRMMFVERQLGFLQLNGTHKLNRERGLEFRWQGNVATTSRDELDSRDLAYIVSPTGGLQYKDQPGSGQHFWQVLEDLSGGGGVDARVRAGKVQLRAGAAAQLSSRALGGRRFRYRYVGDDGSVRGLPGEEMFSAENIGPNFMVEEGTLQEDAYEASLDVYGAFAMGEVEISERFRAIVGARYEYANQTLVNGSRYAVAGTLANIDRSDNDVLPSVNLVYALTPEQNLRGAYSYTLARPRFRELAPFLFFDYLRRRDISGNPDLLTTRIHNADLRWEWFPSETEVFAASVFYKQFVDPIEQVMANANGDATFLNADSGNLFGGEIEARSSLGRINPKLSDIRFGTNIAVMRSRVNLGADQMLLTNQERALYGQSPFVVNVNVGYVNPKIVDVNLLYNVIGSRITDVGIEGLPDTYERPVHRVDLVAARLLRKDLRLKLSVANVLNQRIRLEQEDVTINSYQPGVSFALGLDWTP